MFHFLSSKNKASLLIFAGILWMCITAAVIFGGFYAASKGFLFESIELSPKSEFVVDDTTKAYLASNPTFPELTEYLKTLASERGATYALDVLIFGDLPENIDTHLMGHFVARKLYAEKGIDGLESCTPDLGYACAHAIVIESLFERGMVIFDEVNNICERVTGSGAYTMCFHGFGHGVLAFAEYELPQALKLCEKVGTEKYGYQDRKECIGGAIMEMRGGIHNPDLWEKNGKKYLDAKNPLQLCLETFLKEEDRDICFVYITPFIFDSLGAQDLPTFEEYKPAIKTCDILIEPRYREACYGGFAKEFVGFLFGRDIQKIEGITDAQLTEVITACMLAEKEDGIAACIKYAIFDLRGYGQFGFEVAGRLCTLVPMQFSNYCITEYITLMSEPGVSLKDGYYDEFCKYTEATFARSCKK